MKKTREQKAITLVALIITIVVLLILALVTINAVRGDGIIAKAREAKARYQDEQGKENTMLENYLLQMEGIIGNNTVSGDNSISGETDMIPQIGDKVAYDEGSGKTSSIDSSFVMKDMEWRILDIEDDGTIEVISTQPTDSKLTLSGEEGYLKGVENLDVLCNELYSNGTGVIARSLKIEDIDKLAGIITDADKQALDNNYGILWRYKYESGVIRYSKSLDNGVNWTDYANTWAYSFKFPGERAINSSNYKDIEGNPIIKELKYTDYSYSMDDKIRLTTRDGISMSNIITNGKQWLSSRMASCSESGHAFYTVGCLFDWIICGGGCAWRSYDEMYDEASYTVRPVVVLPSSITLTNVDGVWQIN